MMMMMMGGLRKACVRERERECVCVCAVYTSACRCMYISRRIRVPNHQPSPDDGFLARMRMEKKGRCFLQEEAGSLSPPSVSNVYMRLGFFPFSGEGGTGGDFCDRRMVALYVSMCMIRARVDG